MYSILGENVRDFIRHTIWNCRFDFYGSGNRDDKTTELKRKHLKGFSCKIYCHYAKYTETLPVTHKQLTKHNYNSCTTKDNEFFSTSKKWS